MKSKLVASVSPLCVACGCCVKVCPMQAIGIDRGMYARVNAGRCVGCGKCAGECPGGLITLLQREDTGV